MTTLLAFLVAVVGGFLLNKPLPPEVTHANQILAVVGWGLVLLCAPAPPLPARTWRAAAPLLAALGVVGLACVASVLAGGQPVSPALATLGVLALAALLVMHGAAWGANDLSRAFQPFAIALVGAALGNALVSVVQIFAPGMADNGFIAMSTVPGRAVGNLGQANQLADAQICALAALVPLAQGGRALGRWSAGLFGAAALAMILTVMLSASRTGLLGIGLLATWGVLDRQLAPGVRRALWSAPVLALLAWAALQAGMGAHLIGDVGNHAGNFSAHRDVLWGDALRLIAQSPWLGVGWGQFNFALALTPGLELAPTLYDNAHNLVLQLAVELGVPLAALVLGLLLVAAWRGARAALAAPGQDGNCLRAVLVMLAMIGLHSMLEYPLWYAYFLLPAAWAWGLALGAGGTRRAAAEPLFQAPPAAPLRAWRIAGGLFVAAGASAWLAYLGVVAIYQPGRDATPLNQRIAAAESGLLFSIHADRFLATRAQDPAQVLPQIQRSARVLADGHTLYVWALALEATGEHDKARFVAARLRDLRQPAAAPFFAPCDDPAVAQKPFQCLPPQAPLSWRDLR